MNVEQLSDAVTISEKSGQNIVKVMSSKGFKRKHPRHGIKTVFKTEMPSKSHSPSGLKSSSQSEISNPI